MLLLIRHAQSDHNVSNPQVVGLVENSQLTKFGQNQAKQVGLSLKANPPAVIYHSNVVRTKDTAEIIALQLTTRPDFFTDKRLLEMDKGELVGQLKLTTIFSPVIFLKLLIKGRSFAFKNGESFNQVGQRMYECLVEIEANNPNRDILVVTHGLAIRCVLGYRYNWSVWRVILTQAKNAQIFDWQSTSRHL